MIDQPASPKKPALSRSDVNITRRERVWEGFFKLDNLKLKHALFNGGWSAEFTREILDKGHGAAAIVYDPAQDLIGLVEQFRVGALESEHGPWCLEVVAGMIEEGETPEDVIRRELIEEAGIEADSIHPITQYYSTPGGCSEVIHLFCALADLTNKEGVFGLEYENEDIYFHTLPANEVFATMYNSKVNNAASLIALQWLQINREKLTKSDKKT